ncbi:hypothetical protein KSC_072730 [Ktedonobacter sp. SOSP1-52]|uniref:hypothetical protein n=1 Tax=Ktedonobacter sp. SOSP1-52 TaxID=2778366 RepID=UPI0019158356|nr:hypothetical protein [Ktedonobacter sp. SOSP1-52]GHO68381.1 hypothetical protein KSC_072730 [Ktedonobacter sp. SOSP1-52]
MKGLTFRAWRDDTPVWLGDLLQALGPEKVEQTKWEMKQLECAGAPLSARSLEEACDQGTILTGTLLLDIAKQGYGVQVINGELRGYQQDRPDPWIVLRAVDSSWWDVECEVNDVLETLRSHYPDATALPEA